MCAAFQLRAFAADELAPLFLQEQPEPVFVLCDYDGSAAVGGSCAGVVRADDVVDVDSGGGGAGFGAVVVGFVEGAGVAVRLGIAWGGVF